ncbi:MAG: hypothetical protein AAGK21_11480 [Bacteroidota bacterium]
MRTLALALFLLAAPPAVAQRASDVPGRQAPVALTQTPGTLSLGSLFNAETLDFSQSVEMTYGGGVGGSYGLGLYTASMRWQPSSRLAGRVDIGVAQTLGTTGLYSAYGADQPQVFLRNAELAYRPTESAVIHLRVAQSPYGGYASPYGYANGYRTSPYRGGHAATVRFGSTDDLFFRDGQ